jgi:hypothetical protein
LFNWFQGEKRFNIIFLIGQIVFYHFERIFEFLEKVHGTNNKLQKLTLSLVKIYVIAGCKVLGLLVTSPSWRLIKSNTHVLDMNINYKVLLNFLDRAKCKCVRLHLWR